LIPGKLADFEFALHFVITCELVLAADAKVDLGGGVEAAGLARNHLTISSGVVQAAKPPFGRGLIEALIFIGGGCGFMSSWFYLPSFRFVDSEFPDMQTGKPATPSRSVISQSIARRPSRRRSSIPFVPAAMPSALEQTGLLQDAKCRRWRAAESKTAGPVRHADLSARKTLQQTRRVGSATR